MSRRVVFLTVMPSPYQRDLFQALQVDGRSQIRVLYYAATAGDRHWAMPTLLSHEEVLPRRTLKMMDHAIHLNPSILDELKRETADLFVLSDYSVPTTQIAMRYLTWRKRPWVFWGEAPGFSKRGLVGRFARGLLQLPISRGAHAIAAIGTSAVHAYRGLFPDQRIFNIPYFCDMAPYQAAATRRAAGAKGTIDVLFSGQLIDRKGVDVLIRAFARISGQEPKLNLQILGAGPACEALKALVPSELEPRVEFLGFKQPGALPEVFAAADIFVLASRHDGWGVVVNEALGAGLPIVVSDRVGARDLVQDGTNGFIVPAGEVEELASALRKLGHSAAMRASFGAASARMAESWGLAEGVKRWGALFDQVLDA